MANNYSTKKTDQTTQKFILVKVVPRRYVNAALAIVSGTTYTMTFPYDLESVFEQGTELTKVSGTPSSGEFSFNETTNLLTVNLNAAPSSSNAIVATYNLYYTIERFRVVGKDPTSPTVDLREWLPRIQSSPQVTQSVKNIFAGILSISSSNMTITNDNGEFNQYLTPEDSFYNSSIEVWHFLDEIENFKVTFRGRISALSVRRTSVIFSIKDDIDVLSTLATMGDDVIYYTNDNFTNIQSNYQNQPIRYYFGSVTRYDTIPETVTNLPDAQALNPELMDEAVCTNYTTNLTTSNNREFACGRVGTYGTTDFSFSPTSVDNTDANFTRLDTTSVVSPKIHIGDTFVITGSGTYYSRVLYVDRTNHYVYVTKNASIVATDTINSNVCPSLVIRDLQNNYYYPLYGRDYTATETNLTATGHKLIEVTFTNNFEATLSMPTLDPATFGVFFKIKPEESNQNQADVLKEIIEATGLSANAASFTTAKSSLAVNAAFSIPTFDELDFNSYFKSIERILSSTLGYIYQNDSFEFVYELFASFTPTETISNTEIVENTHSYGVDYKDIATQLVAFNPHYNSSEFVGVSSQTASSNKSRYLHGIDNTVRFRHVLESFVSKITDHINIKSERSILHTLTTKGINFDSEIGDEFILETNDIPGGSTSNDVKIIEIQKQNRETRILATDLYNL